MLRNDTGVEVGNFPFREYKLGTMNEVRSWRDDPDFDELAGIVRQRDLLRWSYPGILYVDLRCGWIHEFLSANENVQVNEANSFGRDEPYYRFVSNPGVFLLMMPFAFLLATLERAVHSFEEEALERGVLPFSEKPT
jgi:hypothetical protein